MHALCQVCIPCRQHNSCSDHCELAIKQDAVSKIEAGILYRIQTAQTGSKATLHAWQSAAFLFRQVKVSSPVRHLEHKGKYILLTKKLAQKERKAVLGYREVGLDPRPLAFERCHIIGLSCMVFPLITSKVYLSQQFGRSLDDQKA